MEDIETVPALLDDTGGIDEVIDGLEDSFTVIATENGRSDNNNRVLGTLESLKEGTLARGKAFKSGNVGTKVLISVGQIHLFANETNLGAVKEDLTETGIENRALKTRVGTNKENDVGFLDGGNSGVGNVGAANIGRKGGRSILMNEVTTAKLVKEILESNHGFGIGKLTGDSLEFIALSTSNGGTDGIEGSRPSGILETLGTLD
mmetsp:Transcript_13972/g.24488  ORF Transcript_13972/g.24488 Transcript_13972/m.24488 type:complete len:205 (-) Transcript_13972:129-743(-)